EPVGLPRRLRGETGVGPQALTAEAPVPWRQVDHPLEELDDVVGPDLLGQQGEPRVVGEQQVAVEPGERRATGREAGEGGVDQPPRAGDPVRRRTTGRRRTRADGWGLRPVDQDKQYDRGGPRENNRPPGGECCSYQTAARLARAHGSAAATALAVGLGAPSVL